VSFLSSDYRAEFHRGRTPGKNCTESRGDKVIKINAEKAPYLCEKLGVWILPTVLLIKDNATVTKMEGFDAVGERDDFPTK